jgi:hypothetical protein
VPVRTEIKTEGGVNKILLGPNHSDMEGWRAQLMAAFGTSSETAARVEAQRIANALGQSDGTINLAELDTVIAVISGQRPRNEIEAMIVSQMAVTHALTMRWLGNLHRSNNIQQQDSNALTVARLTKAFASQIDSLAKLRRGGEQRVVVAHVHIHAGGQAIVGAVTHTGGPPALSKTKDNLMQRTTQAPLSLQMAKRCGAKTRIGKRCRSPVVKGRKRCRMHGGAHGSGAPTGERNGNYRHGLYTAEAITERKAIRARLRFLRT